MLAKDALRTPRLVHLLGAAVLLASHVPAVAGPLAMPGDTGLRHDLQLLADHGLLDAPLTSWPLPWADIAASLTEPDDANPLPAHIRSTLQRVQARIGRATDAKSHTRVKVAGNSDPALMRGFADTPRSKGEVSAAIQGGGARFAYQLEATAAVEPEDGRDARLDGSYASLQLGNWAVSAAMVDRWWGPGWDGSLILSNNARPVPALVLQRERSTAFETPLLAWLGPWQLTTFMGQLESGRAVPDALLFGMRFTFRPAAGLEIGVSRTAQWCGDDRPCDLGTFGDLLAGNDNIDVSLARADEPGNQLGGFDFRWAGKLMNRPGAVYAQLIGEDEAGGLPSRHIGMAGVETWGGWQASGASWRAFLEYADTTVGLFSDRTFYNTAYNHHTYRSGYRYRGKSLGHGADNDSRVLTLGFLLSDRDAHGWQLTARHADLNRDDTGLNPFSPRHTETSSLALRHDRPFYDGRITAEIGLHHSRLVAEDSSDTDPSLVLAWQRGW